MKKGLFAILCLAVALTVPACCKKKANGAKKPAKKAVMKKANGAKKGAKAGMKKMNGAKKAY